MRKLYGMFIFWPQGHSAEDPAGIGATGYWLDRKSASRYVLYGKSGKFWYYGKKDHKKLQRTYPHITVVLAYLPGERKAFDANAAYETVYPFGLEAIPPKYAIVKRNRWMIAQSDAVITYVRSSFGGAFQCKAFAEKNGKMVFCL